MENHGKTGPKKTNENSGLYNLSGYEKEWKQGKKPRKKLKGSFSWELYPTECPRDLRFRFANQLEKGVDCSQGERERERR